MQFTAKNRAARSAPVMWIFSTPKPEKEHVELIARVKAATAQRGAKSKLAAHVGVAPLELAEWMAGRKVPNPKQKATLVKWVNAVESRNGAKAEKVLV
jgi:hypothetical protein